MNSVRPVGIYYAYWEHEWDSDVKKSLAIASRLGFDLFEIQAGAFAEMSPADRKELVGIARDSGMQLSFGIGLPVDRNVSSLDENTRRNGVAYMTKIIEAVGEIGGGMIGGTVHSCWPSTLPEGVTDKSPVLEQSFKSMRELVKIAEDWNVVLNVEVINRFEQFLLNTCEEALDYVREIGSPNCKILLDTFHLNIEEDSIGGAIRAAEGYLSALHLGETNRKPPGTGRMPWGEIKEALDAIGFKGPLVMEPFVRPGGQVGRDICVWRDLMPGANLDVEAGKALEFVRKTLR